MPIYMKFEGIKGSVTETGHVGWIELQSAQMGVHRAVTSATGRGSNREASSPQVNEIVIMKFMDSSSTDLFKASLWGEGKKVTIEFVKDGKPYMTIELENTLVSSYNVSGHVGAGDDKPMESLSFNFTKITFKSVAMEALKEPKKPFTWDLGSATR